MAVHYVGDLSREGKTGPFSVMLRDGINAETRALLEATSGLAITEDPERAQAVLLRSATKLLTPEDFEVFPEMMLGVRVGVGMDNVRKRVAAQTGAIVLPTPGASTEAVAIRSLTLMLASLARVVQGTQTLKQGQWLKGKPIVKPENPKTKVLGVVGGAGRIGRRLRELAGPFFKDVIFSDVVQTKDGKQVPLDTLLANADVISLNAALPVDEETGKSEPILREEHFRNMKPGVVFVNTARGEAISREAALQRIRERKLKAAFDVFPTAPGKKEGNDMFDADLSEMIRHEDFVGTPHTAADDPDTQAELGKEAADVTIQFATAGTVNARKVPDANMPNVQLDAPDAEGYRFALVHPSIRGTIGLVGTTVANNGGNIEDFQNNSKGTRYRDGDEQKVLAVTLFDVADITAENANAILKEIEGRVDVLKSRIMVFKG